MKKILFAANTLDIGGIETALVTLINLLAKEKEEKRYKYDITLVLEKREGIFLKTIDKRVKIIEYSPSTYRIILIRKILNFIKQVKFKIKYKNKFDFSASYATYSLSDSFVARAASKNSCLWGHADYNELYKNNTREMKKFFKEIKYNKFKHVIFVSKAGRASFISLFPEMKDKTIVCNNFIDNKKIEKLANEKIQIQKEQIPTFLNVGRHDEKQKRLSKLIKAASKLKLENYKFKIILIGEGKDTEKYKEMVKKYNLEEQIIFLGKKSNPYPYFKISDCIILTSDYEGYPVVFLESMILNKPIITTKVSDYEEIEGHYGYTTTKEIEDIYEKMKLFIENGFNIREKFDAEKYNKNVLEKLEKIF